jgi:hypothetical protein
VLGLAGLAGTVLAGTALLAACTPGPATSGHPSASAAVTSAASPQPSRTASAPGRGTGTTTAPVVTWAARWGSAFEPPGLGGLNAGLQAQVLSVSCRSAGNCAAGGFYADASVAQQAFVVTEVNGHWGKALAVPGLKQHNTGGKAQVSALSCASAGNCAAAGYYTDFASGLAVPFTAEERDGAWQPARTVPGIAALAQNGDARATAISCPAAGDCAAGGFFASVTGGTPSFVVTEHNGTWGKAQVISGTAAYQGTGQQLGLAAISCAAPGDCAAGGTYTADPSGTSQGFVVTDDNGSWGNARPVPGGHASSSVTAVSCPAHGSCVAGGTVTSGPVTDGFVIAKTHGRWGRPLVLPSAGAITAVSCSAPGTCAAGGTTGKGTGLVVTEAGGKWQKPQAIQLTNAQVTGISCQTDSRSILGCAAVGSYLRGGNGDKAGFAISEAGGAWGDPVPVKAEARLAAPGVPLTAVSCAAGRCSAGGYFLEAGMGTQALLVQG